MKAQDLLQEISSYCREAGLAESTFGRRAVNDGKLTTRLRNGGRITIETMDRIRTFIATNRATAGERSALLTRQRADATGPAILTSQTVHDGSTHPIESASEAVGQEFTAPPESPPEPARKPEPPGNFRFFDNRQKYRLFVNTCSEKAVVAHRAALELVNIHPRPPALRLFDAGVGDGTVLTRVLRAAHARFPQMPFYVVGKEISLEDVRLALQKMADRFFEHPASVLVLTNLAYADAPWLAVKSRSAASSLVWHELPLAGNSTHVFEEQITGLEGFLAENWKAGVSSTSGNPVFERPVVLVIYREDHHFLLNSVIPRPGDTTASFDLVIASQPYRALAPLEFKVNRVIVPLARALGPGGRLIAVHSFGNDPGQEIVQRIWPGDHPFIHDRHQILRAAKQELGTAGRDLNFNAYADARALFRYDMHTLPSEVCDTIGTSTLFAAWNAAIYVSQVEDDRLAGVVGDGRYLDVTREVLNKHGGLWFFDESFVISRRRD